MHPGETQSNHHLTSPRLRASTPPRPNCSPARLLACSPHRIAIIAIVECALIITLIWANLARFEQGPILIQLSATHGIHLMDALIGAAILLTPLLALTLPTSKPKT
jgi:hypothetical protein